MVAKIDDLASFGLTLLDAESGASLGLLATAADRGGARPVVDAALPERLGRYHVLERLGAGGMGVVVAAYDPELDRKVAIKLIHAGRDDEEARARLLREAQAMARLAHPNVVAVHDVGVFAGQVFVAMEFVRGETLGGWLQRQPRGWSEVLAVFVSAGRGLAAAHEAGLVHRDFKPKSQRSPPIRPCPADPRRSPENRRLEGIGNFSLWLSEPPRASEVGKIWGKPRQGFRPRALGRPSRAGLPAGDRRSLPCW